MTSDLHRIESKNRISLSCIPFWQKMIWACLQAHSSLQKKSLGVFRKAWEFSAALETLNQISPGANIQTQDNKSSVQASSRCLSHSARVICSLPKVEHINILLIFILKNSEESTKTKFLPPTFFSGNRVVVAEGSDFILNWAQVILPPPSLVEPSSLILAQ